MACTVLFALLFARESGARRYPIRNWQRDCRSGAPVMDRQLKFLPTLQTAVWQNSTELRLGYWATYWDTTLLPVKEFPLLSPAMPSHYESAICIT